MFVLLSQLEMMHNNEYANVRLHCTMGEAGMPYTAVVAVDSLAPADVSPSKSCGTDSPDSPQQLCLLFSQMLPGRTAYQYTRHMSMAMSLFTFDENQRNTLAAIVVVLPVRTIECQVLQLAL